MVATGFGAMSGNTVARVIGIVLAVLSAILNLVFLAAYPILSTTVITLDVLVIYALDEDAAQLGINPVLSGAKVEDEGLYPVQHGYWVKAMRDGIDSESKAQAQ